MDLISEIKLDFRFIISKSCACSVAWSIYLKSVIRYCFLGVMISAPLVPVKSER